MLLIRFYKNNLFYLISSILLFMSLTSIPAVFADSSLYDRGRAYYYGDGVKQDYGKALLAFEQGTKVGDLDAQTALGIMFIVGVGVENDNEKGLQHLNSAAQKSHPKAQYYLGAMYYLGIGVSTDYNKAYKWINLAAKQGFTFAEHNLAQMY